MKNTLLVSLFFFCSIAVAQQQELVLEKELPTYDNKSYIYTKSVTIRPIGTGSFTVSAAQHGIFFIRPAEGARTPQNLPPNLDKNFVRVERILQSGITTENQITSLDHTNRSIAYQYTDGVGRGLQDVSVKGSPGLKDIIQPYVYETDGWMTETRLPYTITSQNGAFKPGAIDEQNTFYTSTSKVVADSRPYATLDYEKSTLGRVNNAFGPGNLWASKGIKGPGKVNASGVVRKWTLNTNGLPISSSYYGAGLLTGRKSVDEDGNTNEAYGDVFGNIIYSAKNGLVTQYVYDEMSRLRFILPPELVNDYPSSISSAEPNQALLNVWAFQYKYDSRGRITEEKSPGINNEWVYYVYDQWDRVVLTQDGLQRSKSPDQWSFIKYDEFNRPIMTGSLESNNSLATMNGLVSGGRFESKNSSSDGYTINGTFPHTSISGVLAMELHTIIYYDDYSFKTLSGWDATNYNYNASPGLDHLTTAKGLMTGSKVKIIDHGIWLNSVNYYDKNYQLVQSIEEHHLLGTDRVTNAYNFQGWLTKSTRVHTVSSSSTTIVEDYEYDHRGRLLKIDHTINNQPKVVLARYGYNELGQVVETNMHSVNGSPFLQSVDFRYNIRGWLTSINNSTLSNDGLLNDDADDLFGMELTYNEQAHTISGMANPTDLLYNGRISAARWRTNNKKDTPKTRIYGYDYDDKSRLSVAAYAAGSGNTWTDEAGHYTLQNLSYDDNGNIASLKRYAASEGNAVAIDDLTYVYNANGNELLSVEDAGNAYGFKNGAVGVTTEMGYDANGNLTNDLNSFITATYNYLNLPSRIFIDRPHPHADITIDYTYDATGYALSKKVKEGNMIVQQIDYVKGIHYYGGSQAIIFTPVGRATKYNNVFEYEYFLKDHLSNTRVIFSTGHKTDVFKATMETQVASEEQSDFKNVAETRFAPTPINHTPSSLEIPNASAVAQLFGGGTTPNPVGPAKMIQVKTGEQVQMEAYAYYNTSTNGNQDLVLSLAGFFTSGLGLISTGETASAYSAMNNTVPGYSAGFGASSINTPKAYLGYILFNNNYVVTQTGKYEVPLGALNNWKKLSIDQPMPNDGYLYVFVVNESTASLCFFDDIKITHHRIETGLQVVESTDYDPFGYVLAGTQYVNEGKIINNYLYQGDFAEYDKYSQWTRFEGRGNYSASLGRWMSVDPKANSFTSYSTYTGMMNDPINYVDPDGRNPFLIAAIIGGGANVWSNWDKIKNDPWSSISYFGVGAVAGAYTLVNPIGGATMLSVGNQAANILNGHPIDPTEMASDFTFTWFGGQSSKEAMKLGANQVDNMSFDQLSSAINNGNKWKFWSKTVITSADDLKLSNEVMANTVEIHAKRTIRDGVYDLGTTLGKYIGQSKNIPNRLIQHFRKGGKLSKGEMTDAVFHSMPNSTPLEREVYEQYLIDKYGKDNLLNSVNPMGGRRDLYDKMIDDVIQKFSLPR